MAAAAAAAVRCRCLLPPCLPPRWPSRRSRHQPCRRRTCNYVSLDATQAPLAASVAVDGARSGEGGGSSRGGGGTGGCNGCSGDGGGGVGGGGGGGGSGDDGSGAGPLPLPGTSVPSLPFAAAAKSSPTFRPPHLRSPQASTPLKRRGWRWWRSTASRAAAVAAAAVAAAAPAAATTAVATAAGAAAAVAAAAAAAAATRRRALRGRWRGSRDRLCHLASAPCGGRGGPARAALMTAPTAAEEARGVLHPTRRPAARCYRRWGSFAVYTIVTKVCRNRNPDEREKKYLCLLYYALHHFTQWTGQAVRLGRDKCPQSGRLAGTRSPPHSASQPNHTKWQPCPWQAGGRRA